MRRLIDSWLHGGRRRPTTHQPRVVYRTPEPPIGFVRRSDPNFYFLARKF
ncbi:MAG TPA: hypothetical protein VLI05_05775 [Candidatus Saccharimonadia bacterium]|nr:hypothetical protein [Candidatus Saccharimonadia bacterium]